MTGGWEYEVTGPRAGLGEWAWSWVVGRPEAEGWRPVAEGVATSEAVALTVAEAVCRALERHGV